MTLKYVASHRLMQGRRRDPIQIAYILQFLAHIVLTVMYTFLLVKSPSSILTTKFVASGTFKSWLSIWTTTTIIMLFLLNILLSGIVGTQPRNNNNKIMSGIGLLIELIA